MPAVLPGILADLRRIANGRGEKSYRIVESMLIAARLPDNRICAAPESRRYRPKRLALALLIRAGAGAGAVSSGRLPSTLLSSNAAWKGWTALSYDPASLVLAAYKVSTVGFIAGGAGAPRYDGHAAVGGAPRHLPKPE